MFWDYGTSVGAIWEPVLPLGSLVVLLYDSGLLGHSHAYSVWLCCVGSLQHLAYKMGRLSVLVLVVLGFLP